MMPTNLKYPEFVPDQLLTSENLNDMFLYLDEQGRMTRTNLLGIGIVCGFEVKAAADGTSITVTKGTGITSEGHLVAQEQRVYTQRIDFDPAKELYYGKFLTGANTKAFELWELKQSAAVPNATALNLNFLDGGGVEDNRKVVLLFVELLEEANKNCNPESCDDKGLTIRVNLRPLLVRKQDADSANLKAGMGAILYNNDFSTLPEMRMRRFDVPSTTVVTSAGLLTAYKKILTPGFLSSVEHLLSDAWAHHKPLIGSEFQAANPFAQLAEKFAFINDGSIDSAQLRGLQYVYGHFADLLAAYEEFRRTGMELLSACCPDASLFPRHLLLDLAVPDTQVLHSAYRHHFRHSPLFQKRDLHGKLRSLFRRLALMAASFKIPEPSGAADNPDGTIRVTPSRLDASPLSEKAIPYYYPAKEPAARPLYASWNYEKTQATDAKDNLSYHAGDYADKDFVSNPLRYDLEPYNFLRVEGHLGKPFSHVIQNLKRIIREHRLPIDVIGLSLGTDATDTELLDPKAVRDIQVQYEVLKSEVLCCLKRQVAYWGKLTITDSFDYGHLHLASNLFTLFIGNSLLSGFGTVASPGAAPAAPGAPAPAASAPAASAAGSGTAVSTGIVRGAKPAAKPSGKSAGTAGSAGATGVAGAAAAAAAQAAGMVAPKAGEPVSRKAQAMAAILGTQEANTLVKKYLDYQQDGDYSLIHIPPPQTFAPALEQETVTHFALQILDEITELLVLLEAENPLTLDADAVTAHGKALETLLGKLLALIEKELAARRPFQKIKAYVGEAQHTRVDAIAAAMPDMGEDLADTVVLLLLNMPEADKNTFVNEIKSQAGNRTNQAALINLYYGRLDKDGMQVPPAKDVAVVEDPFLKEMLDRAKNFSCLCALGGFAKLRDMLRALLEDLKQANLFSVFAARHPGIQHKAGVTPGGTFLVAYHRNPGQFPDDPDLLYAKASSLFPDGMVVADFYLPYVAYSIHPPVVFQVAEAGQAPEEVTLSLQPNPLTGSLRYSVADETPYAFAHVPNNGTLTGGTAANGVTTQGADNFVFTPARTRASLGNDFRKEFVFQYVKRGVSSPEIRVAVFNAPQAEIKPASDSVDVRLGEPITIESSVRHADKFSWLMQDAAGASTEVGVEEDLKEFVPAKEGAFSFTLRAIQSETGAKAISNTVRINVTREQERLAEAAKTCGSLTLVLEGFDKLPAADPGRFQAFAAKLLAESGIQELFKKLKGLDSAGTAAQLEFYKSKQPDGATLPAKLEGWLQTLADIVVAEAEREKEQRLLALALYRILVQLVLYFACLRKEDLGKAEEQIFADMLIHLKGRGRTRGFLTVKDLTDPEKLVLAGLRADLEEEAKRNVVNNRVNPKPKYARALKAVAAAF